MRVLIQLILFSMAEHAHHVGPLSQDITQRGRGLNVKLPRSFHSVMAQASQDSDTGQVDCNYQQETGAQQEKQWCTLDWGAEVPTQESPAAWKGGDAKG